MRLVKTCLGLVLAAGLAATAAAQGTEPGCKDKPEVRYMHWAWNAQMGLIYATGGPQATAGSLMCKNGVNLKMVRQDDTTKMQEALVAFASALKAGEKHPKAGAHFVTIMGDGSATFLAGLNEALGKLGPEYKAKVVGALGYSRGEDKFMGPPEWKKTPAASKGGVAAAVLRDGDWNLGQRWLSENQLCTNPDEKTWDPDCMNWVAASDYLDAVEKYVAGYCEDRPVVSKGKRTGETKKVCVNAVATWTPGDVNVAQKKGGLVSIADTKQYARQMPAVMIGIDAWMKANRPLVEGLLAAAYEGGDRVMASDQVLERAAKVSAVVYNEKGAGPDYWQKYFRVVTEKDKQGIEVELGGSSVSNLNDAIETFGLKPGSTNHFGAVYKAFGDMVHKQYPELLPSYPAASEILDTSYLEALAKKAGRL
jgi:OOP family OmpA-OmpF porin